MGRSVTQDKVVVHFLDRRIAKGMTDNFHAFKKFVDLKDNGTDTVRRVALNELKALYFVKSFGGNAAYAVKHNVSRPELGKRVKICFKDGETLCGYTRSFSQNNIGFLVVPSDPECNNEKIFVNRDATDSIAMISETEIVKDDQKEASVDYIVVACQTCGVRNKVKMSQRSQRHRCGRCKRDLVVSV
jgi:hypothetical protein